MMRRPYGLIVIVILELFVGVLGIATGSNLLADPSGKGVGLDVVLPLFSVILLSWALGCFLSMGSYLSCWVSGYGLAGA
jgi:hypothetical protein